VGGARRHLVALEADMPFALVDRSAYRRRLAVEVGTVAGGYAWVFPKLDHINIGVVGWMSEGPRLRGQLHRFARSLDLDPEALEHVRGYRLPLRAAGLVDPLSGEGIHSAFLSATLAA